MPVKIYVASLFNAIALKTTGGQHAFFDQQVPRKHLPYDCTHADSACTHLESFLDASEMEVKGARGLYMYIFNVCLSLTHIYFTVTWRHTCQHVTFPFYSSLLFRLLFLFLTHNDTRAHTYTSYYAEQQDCCPPSVNVIHEEMKIWAMNDEFLCTSGLANTSRKTSQPIYAKKKRWVNVLITCKINIRGTKWLAKNCHY